MSKQYLWILLDSELVVTAYALNGLEEIPLGTKICLLVWRTISPLVLELPNGPCAVGQCVISSTELATGSC